MWFVRCEDELTAIFGIRITSIVLEIAADKICNLRDMLISPPQDGPVERVAAYFNQAGQVVHGLCGTHAGLEATLDELVGKA